MLAALIIGFVARQDTIGPSLAQRFTDADKATNWALGFIIGIYAFGVVGMFSQRLQTMAQNGQLEQLCMSPHGLVTNFLAQSVVSAVSSILSSAVLIWLIAKTFGGALHADFTPTVIVLALTFADLIGFGFMVGGLVLLFKQVGQVVVIVRFVLFLLAFSAEKVTQDLPVVIRWIAHALPVTDAAICIKYVLVQGQTMEGTYVSVFTRPSFFLLIINSTVWTLVGISCFRVMEDWSRSKGTLGAY
jgi:ABC-type polysaccharide/polyol phosphate export permease